jgi:hypothetical protein
LTGIAMHIIIVTIRITSIAIRSVRMARQFITRLKPDLY